MNKWFEDSTFFKKLTAIFCERVLYKNTPCAFILLFRSLDLQSSRRVDFRFIGIEGKSGLFSTLFVVLFQKSFVYALCVTSLLFVKTQSDYSRRRAAWGRSGRSVVRSFQVGLVVVKPPNGTFKHLSYFDLDVFKFYLLTAFIDNILSFGVVSSWIMALKIKNPQKVGKSIIQEKGDKEWRKI